MDTISSERSWQLTRSRHLESRAIKSLLQVSIARKVHEEVGLQESGLQALSPQAPLLLLLCFHESYSPRLKSKEKTALECQVKI